MDECDSFLIEIDWDLIDADGEGAGVEFDDFILNSMLGLSNLCASVSSGVCGISGLPLLVTRVESSVFSTCAEPIHSVLAAFVSYFLLDAFLL